MRHRLTSREINNGLIVSEVFSRLDSGHTFAGVELTTAGQTVTFKNHIKGDFHLQRPNEADPENREHDRLSGLTNVFDRLNSNEVDVSYDPDRNMVVIKEIPKDPTDAQTDAAAERIRRMMEEMK